MSLTQAKITAYDIQNIRKSTLLVRLFCSIQYIAFFFSKYYIIKKNLYRSWLVVKDLFGCKNNTVTILAGLLGDVDGELTVYCSVFNSPWHFVHLCTPFNTAIEKGK